MPALAVQIGDRLEDDSFVVGIEASYKADPTGMTFVFSVAPEPTSQSTGTRSFRATEQLRVVRPD